MAAVGIRHVFSGPDAVSSLSISSNRLASAFEDGSVSIWSPKQRSCALSFYPSSCPCYALSFASDNEDILYSTSDGSVIILDLRQPSSPVDVIKVCDDEINSISPLCAEKVVAIADDTGAVTIVSTSGNQHQRSVYEHDNICSSVLFNPLRKTELFSGGLDCCLCVADWKNSDAVSSETVYKMGSLTEAGDFVRYLSVDHRETLHESIGVEVDEASDSGTVSPEILSEHEPAADDEDDEPDDDSAVGSVGENANKIRFASSYTREEVEELAAIRVFGQGLGLRLPMVYCMACTPSSGGRLAVGLDSGSVEIFTDDDDAGRRLMHIESLLGHRAGVGTLLAVNETHLLSGGNDRRMLLWEMVEEGSSVEFKHSDKICALVGTDPAEIYLADTSKDIYVIDLNRA